ncbi:hypothetical protein FQN57_005587 [Myotisia sp. PD_48]|nr:hypothetical protein FQN57_005587 [Myotisia sp. PD_48]
MDSFDAPSAGNNNTTKRNTFIPPSINCSALLDGGSYAHYSPCPPNITSSLVSSPETPNIHIQPTPCALGIDEAGRGPVLGPMVYSAFYLPIELHRSLLAEEHHFDDSKVLTAEVRSSLMRSLCTPDHPLHNSCGWTTKVLSARDISSGMLRPISAGAYNLNAQAIDATIEIIRGVVQERGINVKEVYVDTIGKPETHQARLEQVFPGLKITVAKKADSLYPCVSAASVCAKVTRDAALELCYEHLVSGRKISREEGETQGASDDEQDGPVDWGSGYPSDSKCVGWLKREMDALFGWGNECRFSWGTSKELLEAKDRLRVDWPVEQDDNSNLLSQYFISGSSEAGDKNELRDWYGTRTSGIF